MLANIMNIIDLSIVVMGRNDNYGGDFIERAKLFLRNVAYKAKKTNIRIEIIFVNWNPLPEEQPIDKSLRFHSTELVKFRIITVSKYIHEMFENSRKIPVFEYMAKNVGIRRATGRFILVTNPDIILTEDFFNILRAGLSDEYFYRTNRYDLGVPIKSLKKINLEDIDKFCKKHVRIIFYKNSVRYLSIRDKIEAFLKGMYRYTKNKLYSNINFQQKNYHFESLIHTRAVGDFMLMSKKSWFTLRGYPELPWDEYIDGFMPVMAYSSGLKQYIIDEPIIYHVKHLFGRGGRYEKLKLNYYGFYLKTCESIFLKNIPSVYNKKVWGLGNIKLEEIVL